MAHDLLFHICCGPCAAASGQRLLAEGYEPLFWFMNPNIQPLSEYLKRREAAGECAARLGVEIIHDDAPWDIAGWLKRQIPFADSPARCENCVVWRLEAACHAAIGLNIPRFSTSLLYSRYQAHDYIAAKGRELAARFGLEFVYRDFREDWQGGIDLSKAWGLYRQAWCGCVFSESERYAKKLARLAAAK